MKNILFIRTAEKIFRLPKLPSNVVVPPLGLMYLAGAIRKDFPQEYNIKIIDLKLNKTPVEKLRKIICDFKPYLVGCSVLSCENDSMHEIANLTKRISKDIKFIVGGPHATMYYEEIMSNKDIDIAAIGEGERTISSLLIHFDNKQGIDNIPSIAYRNKDKIVVNNKLSPIENLDDIPFPAWDLIDVDKYSSVNKTSMNTMIAGHRYMGIFTSRGCPYQCIYCHNIFGKEFRKRSANNVFQEILELYNTYRIDEFHIFDDIFNLDTERAKKICDLIIDSGIKIKIAFPNGVRGDILDNELVEKLKLAGTYSITFALETASPRLQKVIKKDINIKKLREIIKVCDSHKLLTKCYFMLGFPTETLSEVKATINFACTSKLLLASFFIVTPQKSTPLFSLITTNYRSVDIDFNKHHYYVPNEIYEREIIKLPLKKLQKIAYFKFFINPIRIIKIWLRTPRKIFLIKVLPLFLKRLIF